MNFGDRARCCLMEKWIKKFTADYCLVIERKNLPSEPEWILKTLCKLKYTKI